LRVLCENLGRFSITCEADKLWAALCYGKLYFLKDLTGAVRYRVNVFPATVRKCTTGDLNYVMCHELAHLILVLRDCWGDDEIDEELADEFASTHGFDSERI
jgi:hypothetical protein